MDNQINVYNHFIGAMIWWDTVVGIITGKCSDEEDVQYFLWFVIFIHFITTILSKQVFGGYWYTILFYICYKRCFYLTQNSEQNVSVIEKRQLQYK